MTNQELNRWIEAAGSYRISVDYENNAEPWWDAARELATRDDAFAAVLKALQDRDEWTGPATLGEAFVSRAASLPGWHGGDARAPHPLLVESACKS